MYLTVASWLLILAGLMAQQPSSPPAAASPLDFEFFRTRIQPIFLAPREGHARCVSCHASGTPMRLQPLSPGATMWTEEESRKNFEIVSLRVAPGEMKSKLLVHALAEEAGGDFFHSGGKHWFSQDDPEWRTFAAWVRGETVKASGR